MGFPGGSETKESTCNAGDLGSILGWEDPLEKGMATHSNILAWRIPMDRGAWWDSPWDHKESDITKQQSTAQHNIQEYVSFLDSNEIKPVNSKQNQP